MHKKQYDWTMHLLVSTSNFIDLRATIPTIFLNNTFKGAPDDEQPCASTPCKRAASFLKPSSSSSHFLW